MADLATPSAADMSTSSTTPAASKTKTPVVKPEKPDEEQYKKDLARAEREHGASQDTLNAIKAKLDLARPNNKDSPSFKRQQELRAELAEIRQKQQGFKTSRTGKLEQIKKLDEQLKSRINEQKTARSKVNFKNVEEIEAEIQRLQKQVDTGTMKLVDEKKALAEVSSLNKQKKGFAGFEAAQKGIDDVKAKIAEIRKEMDDPEAKALSDKYTAITTELDQIKAEQDEVYKNLNALRDERTKAQEDQQKKYMALKEIKDAYHQARRAYRDYEQEAYRQRRDRQRAEREAFEAGKRRQVADQKLEDASAPAYQDEIITAEGLIRYFDPSSAPAKAAAGPGQFAASAQREVDDSGIRGTKLSRKGDEEENYFVGTGGKKGKKGRKNQNASPASTPAEGGKFQLSIDVIEQLAKLNVEPPMNQSDVPPVVEKLKEKLEFWKQNQKKKTEENIAKAQKEIDRLESEASAGPSDSGSKDTSTKPAAANQSVNGNASATAELTQEKEAEADVAEDMKKASIEDKEDEAVEA
ncbi:multicopy suppressor of BFA (Brefeldin A) [Coniosporium apollinis]|uniref:Multicopy suppressor of BFA (Brefeldin A) n=1 Tax=Coniosporium apollinis TaxID=61459 RepID=A0ABQ9NR33_9PEZI|nr:multicopy suppressor of BFA (Brefeldin A) [Coniosporium apollinis]